MSVTINDRTAVHQDSEGVLTTTDVCKTPGKCKPVTYTNIAVSEDAAATASSVLTEGNPTCHINSIFSQSSGDNAGSCGGINSGTVQEKAHFVTSSDNVLIEGQPAVRQHDLMVSNNRNTPTAPLVQPGDSAAPAPAAIEEKPMEVPTPYEIPLATAYEIYDAKDGILAFGDSVQGCVYTYDDDATSEHKENPRHAELNRLTAGFRNTPAPDEPQHVFLSLRDDSEPARKHINGVEETLDRDQPAGAREYRIPLIDELASVEQAQRRQLGANDYAYTTAIQLARYNNLKVYPKFFEKLDPEVDAETWHYAELRENTWVYVFVNGYLWRELSVIDDQRYCDVNLTRWQGLDQRPAQCQDVSRIRLCPQPAPGVKNDIQICVSDVQWSWKYILTLGGMNPKDPRLNTAWQQAYVEHYQASINHNLLEADVPFLQDPDSDKARSAAQRERRLQTLDLDDFNVTMSEISPPGDPQQARYITPFARYNMPQQYDSMQAMRAAISPGVQAMPMVPILVLHDAIGIAARLAAVHQLAWQQMDDTIEFITGMADMPVPQSYYDGLADHKRLAIYRRQSGYKSALLLRDMLYAEEEAPLPPEVATDPKASNQWAEMQQFKTELRERLSEEGIKNYALAEDIRADIRTEIILAKPMLVQWLSLQDDNDYPGNFTTAMRDYQHLVGDNIDLGYQTLELLTQRLELPPSALDEHLQRPKVDLNAEIMLDPGILFMARLFGEVDGYQCDDLEPLKLYDMFFNLHDAEAASSTTADGSPGCSAENPLALTAMRTQPAELDGDLINPHELFAVAWGAAFSLDRSSVVGLFSAARAAEQSLLRAHELVADMAYAEDRQKELEKNLKEREKKLVSQEKRLIKSEQSIQDSDNKLLSSETERRSHNKKRKIHEKNLEPLRDQRIELNYDDETDSSRRKLINQRLQLIRDKKQLQALLAALSVEHGMATKQLSIWDKVSLRGRREAARLMNVVSGQLLDVDIRVQDYLRGLGLPSDVAFGRAEATQARETASLPPDAEDVDSRTHTTVDGKTVASLTAHEASYMRGNWSSMALENQLKSWLKLSDDSRVIKALVWLNKRLPAQAYIDLEAYIKALEAEAKTVQAELDANRQKIDKVNQEFFLVKQKVDGLKQKIKELDQKIKKLDEEIKMRKGNAQARLNILQARKVLVAELRQCREALQDELQAVRRDLASLKMGMGVDPKPDWTMRQASRLFSKMPARMGLLSVLSAMELINIQMVYSEREKNKSLKSRYELMRALVDVSALTAAIVEVNLSSKYGMNTTLQRQAQHLYRQNLRRTGVSPRGLWRAYQDLSLTHRQHFKVAQAGKLAVGIGTLSSGMFAISATADCYRLIMNGDEDAALGAGLMAAGAALDAAAGLAGLALASKLSASQLLWLWRAGVIGVVLMVIGFLVWYLFVDEPLPAWCSHSYFSNGAGGALFGFSNPTWVREYVLQNPYPTFLELQQWYTADWAHMASGDLQPEDLVTMPLLGADNPVAHAQQVLDHAVQFNNDLHTHQHWYTQEPGIMYTELLELCMAPRITVYDRGFADPQLRFAIDFPMPMDAGAVCECHIEYFVSERAERHIGEPSRDWLPGGASGASGASGAGPAPGQPGQAVPASWHEVHVYTPEGLHEVLPGQDSISQDDVHHEAPLYISRIEHVINLPDIDPLLPNFTHDHTNPRPGVKYYFRVAFRYHPEGRGGRIGGSDIALPLVPLAQRKQPGSEFLNFTIRSAYMAQPHLAMLYQQRTQANGLNMDHVGIDGAKVGGGGRYVQGPSGRMTSAQWQAQFGESLPGTVEYPVPTQNLQLHKLQRDLKTNQADYLQQLREQPQAYPQWTPKGD